MVIYYRDDCLILISNVSFGAFEISSINVLFYHQSYFYVTIDCCEPIFALCLC